MCCDFPYNFVWNISFTTKEWAKYDQVCICLHVKYLLCQILMKLEFSRQIF